jgi:hypothetical protein
MEKYAMSSPNPMRRALKAIGHASLSNPEGFTCTTAYEGPLEPTDLDLYRALDACVTARVLVKAPDYSDASHDTMRYQRGPAWLSLDALYDAVLLGHGADLDRAAFLIATAEATPLNPSLIHHVAAAADLADLDIISTRCEVLAWLANNDWNGVYEDADSIAEANDLDNHACLTLTQAWAMVAHVCDPDDTDLANALWPGMF